MHLAEFLLGDVIDLAAGAIELIESVGRLKLFVVVGWDGIDEEIGFFEVNRSSGFGLTGG